MCGIAGIFDVYGGGIEPGLLKDMNEAIAHRGPDDEGYALIDSVSSRFIAYSGKDSDTGVKARLPVLDPHKQEFTSFLGLAHRRFSIIDLTSAGHQPFMDREGSCCMVFNGEIYNYKEVREALKEKGVVFYTQSDTEVFLEAYKSWGTGCFGKLNGFWAVAIYDLREHKLLFSRDRVGKKPLYWTRAGSKIYFASEIKALLRVPEVYKRRQVNPAAVHNWVVFGLRDLDNATLYDGIFSFPAATWAVVDKDFKNNGTKFWQVPRDRLSESDISIPDAAGQVRSILEDSVRIRLRADVPLSVELSGGLDSSALVALSSKVSSQKVTTYTVRFDDPESNEEEFARSVARHYDVDYKVLDVPPENFWNDIALFTLLEEEPYHSPNLHTNQVIWSMMRSNGTKVSLNGAGGDENFAGYGKCYDRIQMDNLSHGRIQDYMHNARRYSETSSFFKAAVHPVMWYVKDRIKGCMPGYPAAKDSMQLLYNDMTNTLMPYWLSSGDKGYMGVPLEVRAPFLDYRLIELAFRLPVTYLFRDGWHKWILRKSLEGLLPDDVLWRKKKMGFPFPYRSFFSSSEGIIDKIFTASKNPFVDLKRGSARKNWKLISFIIWYEFFFNENHILFDEIKKMSLKESPGAWGSFSPQFLRSLKGMSL